MRIVVFNNSPQNCSREAVSKYFGTSLYLRDLSRELLKNKGIFGEVERIMVSYEII